MSGGVDFQLDEKGVASILKSAAVKAELNAAAEAKAKEANARMHSNMPSTAGHEGYKAGKAKDLTFTSVAAVYTGSRAAKRDQAHHQTLNAINH